MKEVEVRTCEDCPFVRNEGGIPCKCSIGPEVHARSHMLPLGCPLKAGAVEVRLQGTASPERRDLADFLPHLKLAMEMARVEAQGGAVELGVLGTKPDGSGRIVARFDVSFVKDLEALVGKPMSHEEEAEETARRG